MGNNKSIQKQVKKETNQEIKEELEKEEFLKFSRNAQIITLLLCLREKQKELKKPPKFVLIKIFKEIRYLFEYSSILNDEQHQGMLTKWIEEVDKLSYQSTKFIYKATRDGFTAKKFHQLCDNKSNTISIIKANDFIFGGFASLNWNYEGKSGKEDPKAFIFSISNPINQPLKILPKEGSYSLWCNPNYGPSFGQGCDFAILSNNLDKFGDSYSNLGYSYQVSSFENNTNKNFLCGSYNFKVQEIEVFQLF